MKNKVWLVEDNAMHAQMIVQALEAEADVKVFEHGGAILEHLSGGARCELVILDWKLPDLSGLDVCRFIRATHDQISLPILMLTVYGHKPDVVEGLEAGANDYLTKPFDATELRARARTLIRVRKLDDERKAAEVERERFREIMIGIIGHDLRDPLAAISVGTDAMMVRDDTSEAQLRLLSRVRTSTTRMSRMIDQLLDLTRSRFGGIRVRPDTLDVKSLVTSAINEFELGHPDAAVTLEAKDTGMADWDADRISQVLSNLLINGRTHGAAGRPLKVVMAGTADEVHVTVCNEGTPIPKEQTATIFDPFHRGPGDRPRTRKGLGLGLYIARQIVEGHGGRIEVDSDAALTCFRLTMPRHSKPT